MIKDVTVEFKEVTFKAAALISLNSVNVENLTNVSMAYWISCGIGFTALSFSLSPSSLSSTSSLSVSLYCYGELAWWAGLVSRLIWTGREVGSPSKAENFGMGKHRIGTTKQKSD